MKVLDPAGTISSNVYRVELVRPAAGEIHFENTDLTTASSEFVRQARHRIQMIFQDPYGALNPRNTVGAAIRESMISPQIIDFAYFARS